MTIQILLINSKKEILWQKRYANKEFVNRIKEYKESTEIVKKKLKIDRVKSRQLKS